MNDTLLLDIVTPQKKVFSDKVSGVFVPTEKGRIGILPRHTNLFTVLSEGEVKITRKGKDWYMAIGGGFMEVTKTKVSILVSRAVNADEINESEIEKAQKEAKDIIAQKGKIEERSAALASLRRSRLELKVLKHHKYRQMPTIS